MHKVGIWPKSVSDVQLKILKHCLSCQPSVLHNPLDTLKHFFTSSLLRNTWSIYPLNSQVNHPLKGISILYALMYFMRTSTERPAQSFLQVNRSFYKCHRIFPCWYPTVLLIQDGPALPIRARLHVEYIIRFLFWQIIDTNAVSIHISAA